MDKKRKLNRSYRRKNKITNIGDNIKFLRDSAGLSLLELSEELGAGNPSAIHSWEKGKTIPSPVNLANIALLFGISVDSLMFENLRRTGGKALNRKVLPKKSISTYNGETYECCPHCQRRIDTEDNNGRFCKYCGQEIEGREFFGIDTEPIEEFDLFDIEKLW